MLKNERLEKSLGDLMISGRRFWALVAVVFILLQAVNVWGNLIPDYADWNTFGFPFIYVQWQETAEYVYFNMLALFINISIVYIAVRGSIYGYLSITKFKIPYVMKK